MNTTYELNNLHKDADTFSGKFHKGSPVVEVFAAMVNGEDLGRFGAKADKAVANTCWGHHASGSTLYADYNGAGGGYASFQISNGSCALNLTNVRYYDSDYPDGRPASEAEESLLYNYLVAQGGNQGNPFAGEGSTVTIDKPGPGMS